MPHGFAVGQVVQVVSAPTWVEGSGRVSKFDAGSLAVGDLGEVMATHDGALVANNIRVRWTSKANSRREAAALWVVPSCLRAVDLHTPDDIETFLKGES